MNSPEQIARMISEDPDEVVPSDHFDDTEDEYTDAPYGYDEQGDVLTRAGRPWTPELFAPNRLIFNGDMIVDYNDDPNLFAQIRQKMDAGAPQGSSWFDPIPNRAEAEAYEVLTAKEFYDYLLGKRGDPRSGEKDVWQGFETDTLIQNGLPEAPSTSQLPHEEPALLFGGSASPELSDPRLSPDGTHFFDTDIPAFSYNPGANAKRWQENKRWQEKRARDAEEKRARDADFNEQLKIDPKKIARMISEDPDEHWYYDLNIPSPSSSDPLWQLDSGKGPGKHREYLTNIIPYLRDIEIDDIRKKDYPDFVDAYVSSASYEDPRTGELRRLIEAELDIINDHAREWVQEQVWDYLEVGQW